MNIDPTQMDDAKTELAKRYHLDFIKECWQKKTEFKIGVHTTAICDSIDDSIKRYKQGESSYKIIVVPQRHGKSDIISRYLPPHLLGLFPDNEITVASYAQDLTNKFSRFARRLVKNSIFKNLYPKINLSKESASVNTWELGEYEEGGETKTYQGSTQWVGIGGGLTGKGSDFAILDDYVKNREDAESEKIRIKAWEWFTDVFMTRLAPVHCVFILATRWHENDIIGRILEYNDKNNEKYNPDFPKFEIISFPAEDPQYKTGYLFSERFSNRWYKIQKATLGDYGFQSLMQGNPIKKGGNRLKVSNVRIITEDMIPKGLTWVRGWDLASSEKERDKDDPDYTVGTLAAINKIKHDTLDVEIPIIFIKDVVRIRAEAPERDKTIKQTSITDHAGVRIGIEVVAGYKDTYTTMKDILMGVRSVDDIEVSKDKTVRAQPLEPVFEAGNVYIVKADWNQAWINEVRSFPNGTHDDQVDSLICCYEMLKGNLTLVDFEGIDDRITAEMYGEKITEEEDLPSDGLF